MITAIDTNVLLDVFTGDAAYGDRSRRALADCLDKGLVLACEVVWAEVTAAFPDDRAAQDAILAAGVTFTPMAPEAAGRAGRAWRAYRSQGGSRQRLVADFLIGAHAATATDRLLTRDRGFYRRYFDGLEVLDPSVAA
jgi:predicted nucleic acid-binding protein